MTHTTVEPPPHTLTSRYTEADLSVFTDAERERFAGGRTWEETAPRVAWELLYRKEPDLYDRLVRGERIHPSVLAALPAASSCVEVAAGTGRLTEHLVTTCGAVIAVEPAASLRSVLVARVPTADVREGFFDDTGLPDGSADLVVSCAAFTAARGHGGEEGLAELDRIAAPGGIVAFVWPADVAWLRAHGFAYVSFAGEMVVEFSTFEEALELCGIFYPRALEVVRAAGSSRVPCHVLGMTGPRDLAWRRKR